MRSRVRRYTLTMAFRTACFISMVFVPGPMRWVLFACALVLPYIALCSVVLLCCRRRLDVLRVGDDEASSLGVRVTRVPVLPHRLHEALRLRENAE